MGKTIGRVGTELHKTSEFSLWLVVSADDYNVRGRVTIVPLTSYEEDKPWKLIERELWAVRFNPPQIKSPDSPLKKESIADCGQLWSAKAPLQKTYGRDDNRADPLWAECCGKLAATLMRRIDNALQIMINREILTRRRPPFCQGDVLPITLSAGTEKLYLVISAEGIDDQRENISFKHEGHTRTLDHVTLVPLQSGNDESLLKRWDAGERTIIPVKLCRTNSPETDMFAICQEVYSIDWRSRCKRRTKAIAHVECELAKVLDGVRCYLDLPSLLTV